MLTKYEIEESEIDKVIFDEFIDRRTLDETIYGASPEMCRTARAIDGALVEPWLEPTEIRINPVIMTYFRPIDISGQFSTPVSYELPEF